MRVIEITTSTMPFDLSPQVQRLRELGAPERLLPTETNRQAILEQRLTSLLGFYKNCEWKPEYTSTDTERVTRYIRFQYQPTMVFTELQRLQESGVITEARIGVLDKQAVFIAATEQTARRKTA